MYEQFYGFRERPFELTPDPRFLFLNGTQRETLATLTHGVTARKGLTVLTGEVGSGKTTLLRTAMASCAEHVTCVHLATSALNGAEFTTFLARQFGLSDGAAGSKALCYEELRDVLLSRAATGCHSALIIDEAHSLSDELFEDIRHLTNLETDTAKLLPIILVGQPELWDRLRTPELRNLRQRVALRCTLRPFDRVESASYIAARISTAGGRAADVFTRGAVTAIHEAAHGLPRAIGVLCDNALINGMALGQRPVSVGVVEEVCREFDLSLAVPGETTGSSHHPAAPTTHSPYTTQPGPPTPRVGWVSRLFGRGKSLKTSHTSLFAGHGR
jgi:type II secretory pathway predicted ATPase ExeA